jgi:hypothetical protein
LVVYIGKRNDIPALIQYKPPKQERNSAVFVLELQASDVHAALGRLLDQARVAGLKLTAISAHANDGEYRISASLDVADREIVDRIAQRIGSLVGVGVIEVRGGLPAQSPAS